MLEIDYDINGVEVTLLYQVVFVEDYTYIEHPQPHLHTSRQKAIDAYVKSWEGDTEYTEEERRKSAAENMRVHYLLHDR